MTKAYSVIISGNQRGNLFSDLDEAKKYLYNEMFYHSPLTSVEANVWINHFKDRILGTGVVELYNYGEFGISEVKIN